MLVIEAELTDDRLPPSPCTRRLLLLHCEFAGEARECSAHRPHRSLARSGSACSARPSLLDWVVLPDHLHAVWTLPPGDDDFSTRWRLIKTIFARSLAAGAGFILSTGSDGRNKADPPTQPENDCTAPRL